MQLNTLLNSYSAKLFNVLLPAYFKQIVGNRDFCIISNDCWGGEIYKVLNRPFNTPFIGLMLMSPCYLKLLSNLQYFLQQPLRFVDDSKYPIVQNLRKGKKFPIALLGETDIEICFLHYTSEEIANEKWLRRIKRIDWDNLYIKYDCGKDYADKESVNTFLKLPFLNKLVFGNNNFGNSKVFVTDKYSTDSLIQFRNCFLNFNPIGWLNGRPGFKNIFDRFICLCVNKYF